MHRIFLDWNAPALDSAAAHLIAHDLANPDHRPETGHAAPGPTDASDRASSGDTTPGEVRLDRAIVVLPGARAGRRLTELLLEHAERRGVRLTPPRMTTPGALPELIHEPGAPLASGTLARRVWALALRSLDRDRLDLLFPHPPDPDDLAGWTTLARLLERLHHEVGGAGLRFDDVVERCADGLLHDDGERWRVLSELRAAYLERLHALGYADRQEARIAAVERGAVATDREIWLVGVVELPGIVRRMLETVAKRSPVRALVHAPESLVDAFDEFGCVRPSAWRDATVPIDDARLVFVGDPAGQAAAALDAIADAGRELAPDEVTIGVPDDEVTPYLEQQLDAHDGTPRRAVGVPIRNTAPYRLLSAIADHLDGRRFETLATLLRHPDLTDWLERGLADPFAMSGKSGASGGSGASEAWSASGETDADAATLDLFDLGPGPDAPRVEDALAVADRYFRESLPAKVDGDLAAGASHRAAFEAVIRALDDGLFAPLEKKRRLAEWAQAILDLLVAVYGDRTLDPAVPANRRIIDACEAIHGAAAALHRLPEAVDEPCRAAQAIRLLLAELEGGRLAPDPEQTAVELLGWLELHLDDAPVLVVTGMNEPFVPESVNADAFLPNALRSSLGLVDNAFRYARDAYQLTAILHSRPRVHLIAGRASATGDPLRPSRLLLAAPPETIAERVLRFYGADDGGTAESAMEMEAAHETAPAREVAAPGATEPEGSAAGPSASTGFRLPPEPVLHLAEPPRRLRVTDFKKVLSDPYRFVLERFYGLEPLDDAAAEMDGRIFGSIAHDVLNDFGRSELTTETDAARIVAYLDDRLDRARSHYFGGKPLPAVIVQIEQLRARLRAFAEWQARRAEEGWTIAEVEASPLGGGIEFEVDGDPILITGRVDRIDHHPERDEWVVFDYKTSDRADPPEATHRVGRGEKRRWVDLQLPLYRHLAAGLSARAASGAATPAARAVAAGGSAGSTTVPGSEPMTGASAVGASQSSGSLVESGHAAADGAPSRSEGETRPLIPAAALGRLQLGYILLPRDLGETGESLADWSDEELAEADETARDVVRLLRKGRVEFDIASAKAYPGDPLASLLGLGQLTGLDGADDGVDG